MVTQTTVVELLASNNISDRFSIDTLCTTAITEMDILKSLPCSININTFKAYIDVKNCKIPSNIDLNSLELKWAISQPKSLRILVLDKLVESWHDNPVYSKLSKRADQMYILDNIDVNIPVKILSAQIKEDIFWRRCFRNRWKNFNPTIDGKKWIKMYMEKYLAETLEKMEPCEYDQESMEDILEVCAPYIEELEVNYLQPSLGERSDHIPFDYVLANLPDLNKFHLTFSTKTIGTHYYLGCSWPTKRDITFLGRGLQKCYELTEFCLHRTRLEPYMLKTLSRCLDKGCTNLKTLAITDCRFGDRGTMYFLASLSKESFPNLQNLILINNLLSQESILLISQAIKGRNIELLDLRLNPIGSDGAGALFSALGSFPIKTLNISACSITETVTKMLLRLVLENKTLTAINLSNNDLGYTLGRNIYRVIGFNKILKTLDLRNTGTTTEYRNKISAVVFQNRDKLK